MPRNKPRREKRKPKTIKLGKNVKVKATSKKAAEKLVKLAKEALYENGTGDTSGA